MALYGNLSEEGWHDHTANRPNTALLVIDVQNGVVRAPRPRRCRRQHRRPGRQGSADDVPVVWVQHQDEQSLPKGQRQLADRAGAEPGRHRAACPRRPTPTRSRTPPWKRAGGPRCRTPLRYRRADRRMHPLHAARRDHPRLRRDARERRPYHRRPVASGERPRRTRSSRTPISTGPTTGLRAARPARSRPRTSTSAALPEAQLTWRCSDQRGDQCDEGPPDGR